MYLPQSTRIVVGVSLVVVTTIVIYFYKQRRSWKKVGSVTKLFLHPIKSMKGISSHDLMCFKNGLHMNNNYSVCDRGFLVIQPDGNMMTARKEPRLVTINVKTDNGSFTLGAPNKISIKFQIPLDGEKAVVCRVWGEKTYGIDCGDDVANWLSEYLNSEYRLLYHPQQIPGRPICAREAKNAVKFNNQGNIKYHDSTPCNLLSEASIEDLNTRLSKKLTVRSFRPNILISGCKPYEEDDWTYIKIGDAVFKYIRHCFRCVLTTVDPDTGVKDIDGNPLKKLREYRLCKPEDRSLYGASPLFGVSLAVVKEGVIRIGDDVHAC